MGYGHVDRPTALIIRIVFYFIGGHDRKGSPGAGQSLYAVLLLYPSFWIKSYLMGVVIFCDF